MLQLPGDKFCISYFSVYSHLHHTEIYDKALYITDSDLVDRARVLLSNIA